jgi:hypothetical protein
MADPDPQEGTRVPSVGVGPEDEEERRSRAELGLCNLGTPLGQIRRYGLSTNRGKKLRECFW